MALNIKNTITIGEEEQMVFAKLYLSQALSTHHSFELTLNWEQFEESGEAIIEKAKTFVGQPISIAFGNQTNEVEMSEGYFKGIVTTVETLKTKSVASGDRIMVRGFSTTILMDGAVGCKSYEEMALGDVVNDVCSPFADVSLNANPLNTDVHPYLVQYNASAFSFLRQLAVRKGEWFYYDGEQLFFGAGEAEVIELKYGVDLEDFSIKMQTTPKKIAYATHDYINAQDAKGSLKSGTNLSGNNAFMSDQSEALHANEGLMSYHQNAAEGSLQSELDALLEKQNEAIVGRTVVLSGVSRNTGLKVGGKISIMHRTLEGEADYGTYVITEINHGCSEAQEYSNAFKALPESLIYPPYTDMSEFPRCEPQRAKVVDNNDPQKLGRIRVRFVWQDTPTPWIRMAQPHSGPDKGFHFIPEIDEEVMVGFEAGNAELPFVMGTLYNGNGKVEEFTTDKNDVKAIRTRSGHTIELNDTDGEETITIYDREQSVIQFNTAEKSIKIQAIENIELGAKNIKLIAEENIELGASKNVQVRADEACKMQSGKDTSIKATGKATVEATKDLTLNGQNLTAEGKQNAEIKGGVQTTVSGTMTAVQGGGGKVEVM